MCARTNDHQPTEHSGWGVEERGKEGKRDREQDRGRGGGQTEEMEKDGERTEQGGEG